MIPVSVRWWVCSMSVPWTRISPFYGRRRADAEAGLGSAPRMYAGSLAPGRRQSVGSGRRIPRRSFGSASARQVRTVTTGPYCRGMYRRPD